MDIETKPDKKADVADVTTVSLRDMYMRLCACRDFEIKLQWERAVFLTAFLIACFAGYGSFMLSVHQHGYGSLSSLLVKCIPIAITFVGIVLSLFWILMAKGSKAWYEHYEQAIAAFARMYAPNGMPDYMIAHRWTDMPDMSRDSMSNNIFRFNGGTYSVSKIVVAIGTCSMIVWGSLFILHCGVAIFGPVSMWSIFNISHQWKSLMLVLLVVMVCVGVYFLIIRNLKSGYLKNVEILLLESNLRFVKIKVDRCSLIKNWIKNQKKQARWYVEFNNKSIRVYSCIDGEIEERIIKCPKNIVKSLGLDGDGLYSCLNKDERDAQ
jgi:hypothetical protein